MKIKDLYWAGKPIKEMRRRDLYKVIRELYNENRTPRGMRSEFMEEDQFL